VTALTVDEQRATSGDYDPRDSVVGVASRTGGEQIGRFETGSNQGGLRAADKRGRRQRGRSEKLTPGQTMRMEIAVH
jgi:hypothetical protein